MCKSTVFLFPVVIHPEAGVVKSVRPVHGEYDQHDIEPYPESAVQMQIDFHLVAHILRNQRDGIVVQPVAYKRSQYYRKQVAV